MAPYGSVTGLNGLGTGSFNLESYQGIPSDVTANITMVSGADIGTLNVSGDFYGNIIARRITGLVANSGPLGSPTTQPVITVQQLQYLKADYVNADLNISDLLGPVAIDGDWDGEVDASRWNENSNFTSSVGGDINAPITLATGQGLLRTPLLVAGDINGNISALITDSPAVGPNAGVTILGAVNGSVSISGDVVQPIHIVGDIDGALVLGGDVLNDVVIDGSIASGSVSFGGDIASTGYVEFGSGVPASSTVTIAGSLVSSGGIAGEIVVVDDSGDPTDGLAGQIIINAANNGGTFAGVVTIDQAGTPFALSPVPYYVNGSSTIGGGAVGEVPFDWHPVDTQLVYSGSDVVRIDLEFYGPIEEEDGSDSIPLVVIDRSFQDLPFCGDPFGPPVDPCTCTASYTNFTAFSTSISGRTLQITPDGGAFPAGSRYRVYFDSTPNSGSDQTDLVCAGIGDGSVQVMGRPRAGTINPSCDDNLIFVVWLSASARADVDDSSYVDYAEVMEWTQSPIDFDYDNDADGADMQFILDNYGVVN